MNLGMTLGAFSQKRLFHPIARGPTMSVGMLWVGKCILECRKSGVEMHGMAG